MSINCKQWTWLSNFFLFFKSVLIIVPCLHVSCSVFWQVIVQRTILSPVRIRCWDTHFPYFGGRISKINRSTIKSIQTFFCSDINQLDTHALSLSVFSLCFLLSGFIGQIIFYRWTSSFFFWEIIPQYEARKYSYRRKIASLRTITAFMALDWFCKLWETYKLDWTNSEFISYLYGASSRG